MDLNVVIFSKANATEKKNAVDNATTRELLNVTENTIKRMVKEKGTDGYYKDRKTLYFGNVSNHWNAWAKSVELYKDKLFINFYVQYGSTDRDECDYMSKFLSSGDYRGTISYEDRYGNSQTSYYRFYESQKADVMRAILNAYIKECEKKD